MIPYCFNAMAIKNLFQGLRICLMLLRTHGILKGKKISFETLSMLVNLYAVLLSLQNHFFKRFFCHSTDPSVLEN